jgi:mannitol-1-/sugar-/sorbitol-6-/2-deoxyglucose-6-phosphatase
MERAELLAYMRSHKHAVLATSSLRGPQAAVVGIAVTDSAEIVFDTLESTRKCQNLRSDPRLAFAVFDGETTIQYEGVADEPKGADLERLKAVYFDVFPDGVTRQSWTGITYFRVRPTWVRYSDFRGAEPVVVEIDPRSFALSKGAAGAVIFDMDGLLLDSEPTWHIAEEALARTWGISWSIEDATACHGRGIPETARRMAERAGRAFDREAHVRELVDSFLDFAGTVRPKRGARELVDALRAQGIPIALGSSSTIRIVRRLLDATGFGSSFDAIVTGDDVEHVKPEPDIFLRAAERLSVEPARCIVLEDSLAGITAAKRAGMIALAVPDLGAYHEADHVAVDLVAAHAQIGGLLGSRQS